jgi:hypothetical protein
MPVEEFFRRGKLMVHTVSPVLRGRGGKKLFLVHFVASAEFDLPEFIRFLGLKHELTVVTGEGAGMQSVEIKLKPAQLRKMIESIPRNVHVAYEEKEPEKC